MKSFQKNVMKLEKKLALSSKKTAILNLYKWKISKSWKKSMQKRAFNIILINSVYRNDESYYPKVLFRKL